MQPLRIAALVKRISMFGAMEPGSDGRLKRDGIELSMNPFCQRAFAKGNRARSRYGSAPAFPDARVSGSRSTGVPTPTPSPARALPLHRDISSSRQLLTRAR